jgi:hypothetical protein
MGWLDSLSGFAKEFGPLIAGGANFADAYSQNRARNSISNTMRDAELRNYADGLREYEATKKYNSEAAAYNAASSAASAAARAATERNRQAAQREALKIQNQYSGRLLDLWNPYVQAGQQVLPQMTAAYGQGLSQLGGIGALLNDPRMMQRVGAAKPATAQDIAISNYFAGGR